MPNQPTRNRFTMHLQRSLSQLTLALAAALPLALPATPALAQS